MYSKRISRRRRVGVGSRGGARPRASINFEKSFTQRRSHLPYSQPVVFLAMSQPAREIRDVCPAVFSEWGATCYPARRRAIAHCKWPSNCRRPRG